MPKLLVTGGAGYIGSHTLRELLKRGHEIVVLDDLAFGHRDALIDKKVEFIHGRVGDRPLLETIFLKHKFDAVLHFAAWAFVGESVTDPLKYYRNNSADALVLLETMKEFDCHTLVFSSTCATYGNPVQIPMTEDHPQNPINPYGQSKLMVEHMLRDSAPAWGLKFAALRYFNACGASADGQIGEDHDPETHLIPLALMAVRGEKPPLKIFGTDYPTADGTCIRDYIHVEDLATAHAAALDYLLPATPGSHLQLNLGTGKGVSVKEILDTVEEVTGQPVPHELAERRAGDPPELVGDPTQAKQILNWEAQHDHKSAIQTAWAWMEGKQNGRFKK